MRLILVALMSGVLVAVTACGDRGSSTGSSKLETIAGVEQFAGAFDDSAGHPRLLLLLSPT